MPSLALVIVNYNTRELLTGCLDSVFASRCRYPFHVILVDNNSTDGSAELVRTQYPQATLLESARNGGFGYANNIALRALAVPPRPAPPEQPASEIPEQGDAGIRFSTDYILFLNPDTVLPPDALEVMVDFLERTPQAGVVGPRMEKPDGTLDLACRRAFPTPLNSLFKLTGLSRLFPHHPLIARYNLTHLREDELAEVDSVMGAFMLVRGTALGQAGLFDERFFMYGEDLDLAYRIKARGWQVFYNPAVTVLHIKGASSRKRSTRSIREFYRAMHIFYAKHYADQYNSLINILVRLGITLRGALALALNATRPAEQKRVS
ncbi:MAG TPA: glycosyltransferase family 2 protein [Chloroflexia bacterium]|jgi:GT2 family glycosyltransferase|nr:glycosyltransferase family 2 protein [Chloroflexia bacterium]